MSGLLLVALIVLVAVAGTAWSVKTRSRWAGNGLLVVAVGELMWVWLLVAAHGGHFPGSMWLTWAVSHLLVAGVGVGTARWMGDTLPGVDGRGWFHLSTVVAAALLLTLGLGSVVLTVQSRRNWGTGVDDTMIVLSFLGVLGIIVWCGVVGSMLLFLRDVRRGRHRRPEDVPGDVRDVDAVVVLGAGLIGDRVSDVLAARCDRGAAAWRAVEHAVGEGRGRRVPLIVSGGRGEDEPCPEAEAMRRYYARRGFPRDVVLEEPEAGDTTENLHFSLEMLHERHIAEPFVLICTSDFHVMRTERIVSMLREERGGNGRSFDAVVLGAPTPKPAIPASYLREFVALSIHRVLGRA